MIQLLRSVDRVRRAWKNASPGTQINKSQFFTLMALRNKGGEGFDHICPHPDPFQPMTLSALAKAMHQSMPAVSQRITKLEEMGCVERRPDEHDRRTVWIGLTEQGNALLSESCHIMFRRWQRVMERLEQQDAQSMDRMIDSFNRLADAVQAEFGQE